MPSSALRSVQEGYVTGLVSGCKSLREMCRQGLMPYGKSYCCQLLASEAKPYEIGFKSRVAAAPRGGYLVVDGLFVAHEGEWIEGLGKHYNSSRRGAAWGHRYLSSAFIYPDAEVYMLSLGPWLSAAMSTDDYPYKTASQKLTCQIDQLKEQGYELEGVLVDSEFISYETACHMKEAEIAFTGRFKRSNKVIYQGQSIKAKDLAQLFPPGKARYYSKLGVYIKRLTVELKDLGVLDLIIVWKAQGTSWYLSTFLSTIVTGIQELVLIYKLRWGLEVRHRLLKQNLALGHCQCLSFAAQLQHVDLAIKALHLIDAHRLKHPDVTWRQAQEFIGYERQSALLTEQTPNAA